MKIILIQVLLPLATYFIGVLIGMRYMKKDYDAFIDELLFREDIQDDLTDQEEIQHVGYTAEQLGYDK